MAKTRLDKIEKKIDRLGFRMKILYVLIGLAIASNILTPVLVR